MVFTRPEPISTLAGTNRKMNAALALLAVVRFGPTDEYAQAWDKAAGMIRQRYYARESRKDEMERLLKAYEPKAKAANSKAEFRDVVNAMIADFKDSHFALLSDEDQGYYNFDSLARSNPATMPQFGAWFRKDPGGYTVQMVINGTEAERADIRKGDVVITVDGEPFAPVVPLKDKVGKTVTLQIRRGSQALEKKVEVQETTAKEMFVKGTRDSARIIEKGGKKIAYVHLWTMSDEDQKNALSNLVYGKFKDTDAFILDIRDGFGGRPEGFGDPFFRPQATLEWKFGEQASMKQLFGYGKPMVLLTNGGSRSAKEVFSFLMKKSKRATLVGSTTAGHVLGTTPARLNDWAYLEIPIVDVLTDGKRIEGKGVSPDVPVKNEFDEKGKDLYIEKALEILSRKK